MKLFPHQVKFEKDYTGPNILVHEAGTGKTICACLWLADGRDDDALVICPKRVVKKWGKELKKWGAKATVVSKEDFKKLDQKQRSAVVVDEADWFASPLFTRARSKMTKALYNLIKDTNPETLFLTATPIRSSPWNLHTILALSGKFIDHKKWRDRFFELKKMPYMPRPGWLPKGDWRTAIVPVQEKNVDIVLMSECVGYLPPSVHEKVKVKCDPFDATEWEGSKAFFEPHRSEQLHKAKHILEVGREYRKVLVVAYYTEQINELAEKLGKNREVFVLNGQTKDQEQVIEDAQNSKECFFIVQASVGEGFDADTFSAVVFASMSYAVRDYVQMKARVRRIHNLHPVIYYYLLAGQCDKTVYRNVMAGRSFVPSEYRYETTGTTEEV